MSDLPANSSDRLSVAAASIQSRLFRVQTASFFLRFTPWFVAVAFPTLILLRFGFGLSRIEAVITAVIFVVAWLVVGLILNLSRRPDPLRSLAMWDAADDKKDLFSSAWFFESERRINNRDLAEGEKLHVARAIASVDEVSSRLPRVIAMPRLERSFAALAILAVAAVTFLPKPAIVEGEQLLTEAMQAEANKQSARLKDLAADLEKMEGKDEADKAELEKLRNDVDDAAESLADSEGQTANEMLEGLEERARAAEKLAEKLGAADNLWASEAMILEMSQHADFADLAVTIKEKNAATAATEADEIALSLTPDDLKAETRDRMTTALERIMQAATGVDKTKAVGERVGNASRKLQSQQAKTAAGEFKALAAYFRTVKQQNESRKKLEELAKQLRDAGSRISGSKIQKMKQLSGGDNGNAPKGSGGGEGNPKTDLETIAEMPVPMPNQPMPQLPQQGPNGTPEFQPGAPQAVPAPVPGLAEKSNGENGLGEKSDMLAAPVPGQQQDGKGKGDEKGLAMNPDGDPNGSRGKGAPQQNLMAPIPGIAAPAAPQSAGAMASQTGGQSSGSGQSAQPGSGGLEAGEGTAAMAEDKTAALKAAQDATVIAKTSENGDSTTRAIEGKARTEAARRQSQKIMINAISAEEQALDEKALPLSRKTHVQRYFNEILKQFEDDKN